MAMINRRSSIGLLGDEFYEKELLTPIKVSNLTMSPLLEKFTLLPTGLQSFGVAMQRNDSLLLTISRFLEHTAVWLI